MYYYYCRLNRWIVVIRVDAIDTLGIQLLFCEICMHALNNLILIILLISEADLRGRGLGVQIPHWG